MEKERSENQIDRDFIELENLIYAHKWVSLFKLIIDLNYTFVFSLLLIIFRSRNLRLENPKREL